MYSAIFSAEKTCLNRQAKRDFQNRETQMRQLGVNILVLLFVFMCGQNDEIRVCFFVCLGAEYTMTFFQR